MAHLCKPSTVARSVGDRFPSTSAVFYNKNIFKDITINRNVLFNNALNTFYLRKEGNVLFNDTLNTFYLRLYGVRHGKGPLG